MHVDNLIIDDEIVTVSKIENNYFKNLIIIKYDNEIVYQNLLYLINPPKAFKYWTENLN